MAQDTDHTGPIPETTLGALLVGVLLLATFFVAIPLWFAVGPLSFVVLEPVARAVYVAAGVVLAVAAAVFVARHSALRIAVTVVVLLALVGTLLAGMVLLRQFGEGFAVTETVETVVSPDHRFTLVHQDVDSGALGLGWIVEVRGRFIPGVIDFAWRIDSANYPDHVGWSDGRHVVVDGRTYAVPSLMLLLAR